MRKPRLIPLRTRKSKVHVGDFARPFSRGGNFSDFLSTLPRILAGNDLRDVISEIALARMQGKPVILGIGAHVIKVGLSPIIIDALEEGIITCVAMNGAGAIHDLEIAMAGKTSEDVEAGLSRGSFGMAEETGRFFNNAVRQGAKRRRGIGRALGDMILKARFPYGKQSILAAGVRCGVPVTVHVAIGTDTVHVHPGADGASLGEGSLRDFRTFSDAVSRLEGGVYLNVGAAVILPEVFLKALTLVRNTGARVRRVTTVNMDFIQHYRPTMNVVRRPTQDGGRGYALTGHHEILVPLLLAGVKEALRTRA